MLILGNDNKENAITSAMKILPCRETIRHLKLFP